MAELAEIVKADYGRFPAAQTYEIYAEDVRFKDPVYDFQGLTRYKAMIGFITRWFAHLTLDLHDLAIADDTIQTRWTMSWNAPLPWQPRISVTGRSELRVNAAGKICAHVDTWDCTRWDVIRQHFPV